MNGKPSLPLQTLEIARSAASSCQPPGGETPGPRSALLEFLRYFVASAGALCADVGLYRLGLWLGWAYPLAALLGFCVGAVVAYVASVRWVFSARAVRNAKLEFGLFVAVGVAGLLLTELLLWLAIGRLGLPPMGAKLGTSTVVFGFNFIVRKLLLFSTAGPGRATRSATPLPLERAP